MFFEPWDDGTACAEMWRASRTRHSDHGYRSEFVLYVKGTKSRKKIWVCDINPSSLPNKVFRTFFNGLSYPTSIVGNSGRRTARPVLISYSGCAGSAHVLRPWPKQGRKAYFPCRVSPIGLFGSNRPNRPAWRGGDGRQSGREEQAALAAAR